MFRIDRLTACKNRTHIPAQEYFDRCNRNLAQLITPKANIEWSTKPLRRKPDSNSLFLNGFANPAVSPIRIAISGPAFA